MKKILSILGHQEWLRFGVRDRIIRFFHDPDTCHPEYFDIPFFGYRYSGNFDTFIDWSTFYYGAYSKYELLCMKDFLSGIENPIVFDVGANIGHHALFASSIANTVHAFEPYPPVAKKIKEKIEKNFLKHLILHEIGLGNQNEVLAFSPPTDHNTGTGSFNVQGKAENTISLKIQRLDDYISSMEISKIDFMKMDIEGYEIEALKGMQTTLSKFRPICFFEWSQNESESGIRSGEDYFPEDYLFYSFKSQIPKFVFFQKKGYRLEKANTYWNDGNLMAIPKEKFEQNAREECRDRSALSSSLSLPLR